MSQRIIDVDAAGILTKPIQVKLAEQVYTLPGDVPAPLFARLIEIERTGATADEIQQLYDELLALFRQHQPELERLPVGVHEMVHVVGFIYSGDHGDDAGGPGEDPTSPTKTAPAPKKSGSSTSSARSASTSTGRTGSGTRRTRRATSSAGES